MKPSPKRTAEILALLAETPRRIAAAIEGRDAAALHRPPGRRAWSAVQVLAHVRACAEVWGETIDSMLVREQPDLPLVDPRAWARSRGYQAGEFRASFESFIQGREKLLAALRPLSIDEWARTANIDGRRHSVFSQARRMALHEVEHCDQLEAMFKEENAA